MPAPPRQLVPEPPIDVCHCAACGTLADAVLAATTPAAATALAAQDLLDAGHQAVHQAAAGPAAQAGA